MRIALLLAALPLSLAPLSLQSLTPFSCQDPAPHKPVLADAEPAGPAVGKPTPRVRLNDHTGKAVAVGGPSDGWTVLAFYPKAATPG